MNEREDKPKRLMTALEDHSIEGIAILTAEPSRVIRTLIYIMVSLVLSGLLWSFVGRADVIVTAHGRLGTQPEAHRIYPPYDGVLADIYIEEGMPVSKGDILARINSPAAIDIVTQAFEAQMQLKEALRRYKLFLAEKKAMEQKIKALEVQIDAEEKAHEKRIQPDMTRLAEEQRQKLEKARAKVDKAKQEMERTKKILQENERLFESPGSQAISRQVVEKNRDEYQSKAADYELAEIAIKKFEVNLNKEYQEKQNKFQNKSENLKNLYAQYEEQVIKLEEATARAETEVRIARISADKDARVTLEDIDEDSFVRITAPVSGVLTNVALSQPGDKVDAKMPLAKITPADARMMLFIEILEQDRGFLREGSTVKVKFNAFPYPIYGFIDGLLEYIAPSTTHNSETKKFVYEGHVSLERDHFLVGNAKFPLNFGMTATAEIVVRQRRLIDMALDPFREFAG